MSTLDRLTYDKKPLDAYAKKQSSRRVKSAFASSNFFSDNFILPSEYLP